MPLYFPQLSGNSMEHLAWDAGDGKPSSLM